MLPAAILQDADAVCMLWVGSLAACLVSIGFMELISCRLAVSSLLGQC